MAWKVTDSEEAVNKKYPKKKEWVKSTSLEKKGSWIFR